MCRRKEAAGSARPASRPSTSSTTTQLIQEPARLGLIGVKLERNFNFLSCFLPLCAGFAASAMRQSEMASSILPARIR